MTIQGYGWMSALGLLIGTVIVLAFCDLTGANRAETAACLALVPIGTAILAVHLTLTARDDESHAEEEPVE